MRKIIALIIALVFIAVDGSPLMAKPARKKTSTNQTQKGKKSSKSTKPKGKAQGSKSNAASKIKKVTEDTQQKKGKPTSTKAELKEWQERKKAMEPLQLKDLVEENHHLKTQKRKLDTYLQELELKIKIQEEKNEKLNQIIPLDQLDQLIQLDQLNQAGQFGQPSEAGQLGQASEPGRLGKPGQPAKPGQSSKPGQPAQLGQPSEPGQSAQPNQVDPASRLIRLIRLQQIQSGKKDYIGAEIAGTGATPRDPDDLDPGTYQIDQVSGQVFIDGIPDNRYGVDQQTGKIFIKGVIFKVQVSADKNIDLSDVLIDDSHHTNLEQEKTDTVTKYTIGHFRNYWEADKLKKGLRKMGVRWAWIVPYKDGKRVLLKEVLDTVIAAKDKKITKPKEPLSGSLG